jgi:hypothetical protein
MRGSRDYAGQVHAPAGRRNRALPLRGLRRADAAARRTLRARCRPNGAPTAPVQGGGPCEHAAAGAESLRGVALAGADAAAGCADGGDRGRSLRDRRHRPPAPAVAGSPTRRSAAAPRSGSSAPRRAKRRPRTRSCRDRTRNRPADASSWGRFLPRTAPAANSAVERPQKKPGPLVPTGPRFYAGRLSRSARRPARGRRRGGPRCRSTPFAGTRRTRPPCPRRRPSSSAPRPCTGRSCACRRAR